MLGRNSLHIAIAAEQAIVRRGLAAMALSIQGVELVGEAQDLEEAQELCGITNPDLLLLDASASQVRVDSALASIRKSHPDTKALVLVNHPGQDVLLESSSDGVTFYLSRNVSEDEFCQVLQHIGQEKFTGMGERSARTIQSSTEIKPAMRTNQSVAQELAMAGQMQANILPAKAPTIPGYDVAARLLAARETSGDFYDFIPVSDRHWGIVIADVADKGMGAALYMTLTSTLFRGFAPRQPTLPALTLDAANARILSDTRGSMFVTAFFGILEPHLGRLRYANAGHPPPLLVKSQRGKPVDQLVRTGMAIGVQENYHWSQKLVTIAPGDVLVLYTDGIFEAQDSNGEFFGVQRLQNIVRNLAERSSKSILDAILTEVHQFTAGAPGQDDIALVVIRRKQ